MMCRACDHPLEYHGDRAITACDGGLSVEGVRPYGIALRAREHEQCFCLGFDAY